MVSYLFGLESMAYLTTGLVDAGVPDYSIESAICKVAATEFTWYQANRALQLAGGEGYMRDQPYEKILRDLRIFPIFEGANDVLRVVHRALRPEAARRRAEGTRRLDFSTRSARSACWPNTSAGGSSARCSPDRVATGHPELEPLADAGRRTRSSGCATLPSRCCASTARRSWSASSSSSGSPTRWPTSTRRSRCCRA